MYRAMVGRKTKKITVSAQTRYLRVEKKRCPECGKTFERAAYAIYCSNRCTNRASYHRHAEAIRATRRAQYKAKKK
jgi:hypothetical protein